MPKKTQTPDHLKGQVALEETPFGMIVIDEKTIVAAKSMSARELKKRGLDKYKDIINNHQPKSKGS